MFGRWGYVIFAVYIVTRPFTWTYGKGKKIVKAINKRIKED